MTAMHQPATNTRRCYEPRLLHKHQTYQRNADTSGQGTETVHCFRCPRCPVYVSVIPRGMLPYRCLPVSRLEERKRGL